MFYFNLLPKTQKSKGRTPKLVFVGGMSDNFESDEIQALNLPVNNFFLNTARTKDWVEITQMRVDKDTFSYLQNLGLKPGTAAEIISQTASGSVVVRLNRQQIGLGADIARRLIVTFTNKQDNEN